jgi:small-conductance mechanosensitive channel
LKTFTFSECYHLLDVDAKTFRRWLDKAGIDPEKQVSKADSRVKFLTENQIEDLALAHGRPWPPLPKPDDQAQPGPGSVKLLSQRVDELAAQLAGAYERIGMLEALNDVMQQQIESLTKLLDNQAEQIAALTVAQQQERPTRRTREQQPADAASGLPDGLIPWRTFANLHRTPQTTTSRYIQQGHIHVIRGKWKVENGYVKEALDAKGRRDFWVQFHNSSGFTACDDCPHTLPEVPGK